VSWIAEMPMQLSVGELFCLATQDMTVQNPVIAYELFVAATGRRDVEAVLAGLSERYGAGLRNSRAKTRFSAVFELWCGTYPRHVSIAACFIDGDTATMEAQYEIDGTSLPGRVTMVHDGSTWRVDSESCADGRTRIPMSKLAPCKLSHAN
jgi:hypothetical protein